MNPGLVKLMMKYNMSCKEVEGFLMDYLEGNLGFLTRVRFNLHIAMCPDCPKYIEEYKNTVALGKSLYEHISEGSDAPIPEEILQAIVSARKKA